jgi:hypothetical protein
LLRFLDERKIGLAISSDMGTRLKQAIEFLPEDARAVKGRDQDAMRKWAQVAFVPDDRVFSKQAPAACCYLALRILKSQGSLFADGTVRRHFALKKA